jgi:hypothetical protein
MLPSKRVAGTYYGIEWAAMDIETSFFFTYDNAFLHAEKNYMEGYTDYINGDRRLWAAETLAKGEIGCD